MPDAPQTLLFQKVIHDAPPRVEVGVDGHLAHIVQQVEVEIFHAAFLQLLLKDRRRVIALAQLMPRVFRREQEALSRVFFEHAPHHPFGFAAVVGVCRVKVIHAMRQGVFRHLRHLRLDDFARLVHRQAHRAKAQHGQLFAASLCIDHGAFSPPFVPYCLVKLVTFFTSAGWSMPFCRPSSMHLSIQAIFLPMFFIVCTPSSSSATSVAFAPNTWFQ